MHPALLLVAFALDGPAAPSRPLSEPEAAAAVRDAWDDLVAECRAGSLKERGAKAIQAGGETLPFLERTFGKKPKGGHALFISLHGGGGGPAAMNDGQWRNQIRLYEPQEGVVVAPRAPGNTWDLWHQAHIDPLLDRLILSYLVDGTVDPNRVYLLGYSAGGDGVFQLAPRTADRYAAASMMAGHPNETQPDGLRNLPFSIWMGGDDAAYDRNKIAGQWKEQLAALHEADPDGYEHKVVIYPNTGHWMNGRDRAALPWMARFDRDPWPKRIVWLQDDVTQPRFYWLEVPADQAVKGTRIVAAVDGQRIDLTVPADVVKEVTLYLSDALVNLDRPVVVAVNGAVVHEGVVPRTRAAVDASLASRPDPAAVASAALTLPASPPTEPEPAE
ncbi:dienelactone hydrolase family protein [Alienimonas californiensis]|uniref:Alpha/beta hydrolase family protein n=1 Tax=Alienimonas californiensis TaxID=2527989 RepID=A0A517P7A2_9PLAN|nr:dienelactone hydrolase family protein [Alienimonas californiensis]QDT15266.1 Alpha/beta hydrolase family protein [Alienimonas californiensis]